MAEDYLTDDEQLEHVKQLFAEYGPWTFGAVVVGLGLAFGYRYYNQHMNERAVDASAQFADMSAAVDGNNPAKARQIADGLIQHGASPSLPAGVIAQGTLQNQRVITATLATIGDVCARANMESPALLIVGEVVALHASLAWFNKQPLRAAARTA